MVEVLMLALRSTSQTLQTASVSGGSLQKSIFTALRAYIWHQAPQGEKIIQTQVRVCGGVFFGVNFVATLRGVGVGALLLRAGGETCE
jgi:hypothetical protein